MGWEGGRCSERWWWWWWCRINPCEHTTDRTREESISQNSVLPSPPLPSKKVDSSTVWPPPPSKRVQECIIVRISAPNPAKAEETPPSFRENANSLLTVLGHFFFICKCFLDRLVGKHANRMAGHRGRKSRRLRREGRFFFRAPPARSLGGEGHKCAPSGTEKFLECLRPSSSYWSALFRLPSGRASWPDLTWPSSGARWMWQKEIWRWCRFPCAFTFGIHWPTSHDRLFQTEIM